MPRRRSLQLTEAELRLMHVLWRVPRATVRSVLLGLRGRPHLAYNTVLTTLRILEHKGYVDHGHAGRAFVYRALISQGEARRRAIRHLLARLFGNSPAELVATLLGDGILNSLERIRIKSLLAEPSAV